MGTKLNGIVIDGKFYKAVKGECEDCALQQACSANDLFEDICIHFSGYDLRNTNSFLFSPELTEKLKGE